MPRASQDESTLDQDLWLGPAQERPFNPAYVPFKWRGWWDFGTGALGDIGCHAFDPVPRPRPARCQRGRRGEMPALKAVWYDGGLRPPRPAGLPERVKMGTNGRLLVGDLSFILEIKVQPEARRNELGEVPKTIPRVANHYGAWAQACTSGPPAGSTFDFAGPLAEAVLLGNVALRHDLRDELTGKKLLWDSAALRISNSDDANQFLRREYRAGWAL